MTKSATPKAPGVWHDVQPEEDLQIIAADYGIKDWQKVYDDPKNAELRAKRPNPQVLYKGDRVWIPKLEPVSFEVDTDAEHRFVLYPPRIPIRLKLLADYEQNAAGLRYEIWCDGDKYDPTGTGGVLLTGEGGAIEQDVPVSRIVEVRVFYDGDDQEPGTIEIHPGHVDPIETVEGVQNRLRSLGYSCGEDPPDQIGEHTKEALLEFQEDNGLDPTGDPNDETRAALTKLFGA